MCCYVTEKYDKVKYGTKKSASAEKSALKCIQTFSYTMKYLNGFFAPAFVGHNSGLFEYISNGPCDWTVLLFAVGPCFAIPYVDQKVPLAVKSLLWEIISNCSFLQKSDLPFSFTWPERLTRATNISVITAAALHSFIKLIFFPASSE